MKLLKKHKIKFKNGQLSGDEVILNFIASHFSLHNKGLQVESVWCG